MDGSDFEWSVVTPEFYDAVNREALHVLNVNLIGDLNRNRVLTFTCARVLHFARHLPKDSSQRIRFDLRGQLVSNKNLDQVRQTLVRESAKHGIHVAVEFLTN